MQADSDKQINLPSGRGYRHFHDDGDVFSVCDTKADGYGVTGGTLRLPDGEGAGREPLVPGIHPALTGLRP
ncbi:hypothetical protein ACFWD7_03975 [Streptomyces mirabilis]|uniref:hypothetical protein n=1 Tax=Streptomyces mirabilis TaxID=68239 RepID=UPI0021C22820|nr:hypothetical protein [Streptomyces mirabilis]MCT9107839.1 hypothetical protein [Streptomyces mirabilis]